MKSRTWILVLTIMGGLVLLSNCSGNKDGSETNTDSGKDVIRIMPLGNSITYGNYHPEPRPEGEITGYRQALWHMLKDAGYHVDFVGSRTTGADAEPIFDAHNEGYPGWTDDQIKANVYKWLKKNPPDIIILHIGTNGLDPDPSDVEGIFEEIDRYEEDYDHHIKVIMTKIINRSNYSQLTTQFNQNIEKMALDRVVRNGDDIEVIDMEFETEIDYRLNTAGGEMFDNLHPFVGGHKKMAIRWFKALKAVLPKPEQTPIVDPEFMAKSDSVLNAETRDDDSRINKGLVALYKYQEGSGNIVHDVSGFGDPLDLYINYEGNIIWDTVQGLEITRDAILVPSDMNMKVVESCIETQAITLETWIRTGSIEQDGPSNIITISDPLDKGIALSQEFEYNDDLKYYFSADIATSNSIVNDSLALATKQMYESIALQHLVYTRNADGTETFYVDGEEQGSQTGTRDFSSWNSTTFKLSLCNSLGFSNPWKGKLFLTAIYNVALSPDQVDQNYLAGHEDFPTSPVFPEQPVHLASSPLSAIAAKLTWEDHQKGETGFVIERKKGEGAFGYVASVPSNVTEFVDTDLTANSQYWYRIKALNDYGQSPYSALTSVETLSDESLVNVALKKSATQSSTTFKGHPSRGIDGITDGIYSNKSVTHTAYELNAWWEVDLEEVYYIDYLEIWNRTDQCCIDRMARFYVFISDKPFKSYDFQKTLEQPGVQALYQEFFPDPKTTFNVAGRGRYIRIQLSDSQNICLAELVAMGNTSGNP